MVKYQVFHVSDTLKDNLENIPKTVENIAQI